jgi:hypothetical protein
MSRLAFGGLVALVMAVALGIGWFLSAPPPLRLVHNHFRGAGEPPAEPIKPTGADTEPGWEQRKVLRDHLAAAMDQMKGSPCNPDVRAAFFSAFADRGWAMTEDSKNSSDENGPGFWRSADDQPLNQQLDQLRTDGYITDNELARAMIAKHFTNSISAQAGPQLEADRCQPGRGAGMPPGMPQRP